MTTHPTPDCPADPISLHHRHRTARRVRRAFLETTEADRSAQPQLQSGARDRPISFRLAHAAATRARGRAVCPVVGVAMSIHHRTRPTASPNWTTPSAGATVPILISPVRTFFVQRGAIRTPMRGPAATSTVIALWAWAHTVVSFRRLERAPGNPDGRLGRAGEPARFRSRSSTRHRRRPKRRRRVAGSTGVWWRQLHPGPAAALMAAGQ